MTREAASNKILGVMGSRMGDCCFESLMVADKILVCILVKLERAKKGLKVTATGSA